MSRHRNIKKLTEDDYEDDFDALGRSLDEHEFSYGASPGTMAQFTYDRNQNPNFFFSNENPITEEEDSKLSSFHEEGEEEEEHKKSFGEEEEVNILLKSLSIAEKQKLYTCLDEVRGLVSIETSERDLISCAISANFDPNNTLNLILNNSELKSKSPKSFTSTPQPSKQIPSKPQPQQNFQSSSKKSKKNAVKISSNYESKTIKHELEAFGADGDQDIAPSSTPPSSSLSSSPLSSQEVSIPRVSSKSRIDRLDPKKVLEERVTSSKQLLNLVVIGHVDAGKSTLMGHLLLLLGNVSNKNMHRYEVDSKKAGKASFAFAWILDETEEERTRGVTMDIAQRNFETPTKKVNLIDAPGHKDFIPNMITGASQAEVAILVVNGSRGEFETGFELGGQTREHTMLVKSLGVSQIIVAVNKMDAVGWKEERFKEIKTKMEEFLRLVGFKPNDVTFVPCSGLVGTNLTDSSPLHPWFQGPTLLQAIDNLRTMEKQVLSEILRIGVTDVFKASSTTINIGGVVYSGNIQSGDRIIITPSNQIATIKGITQHEEPTSMAFAGDSVLIQLANVDLTKISIGSVLCDLSHPLQPTSLFRARVVLFQLEIPITKGYQVVLHYQSTSEQAYIARLISQLHKSTGQIIKNKPRCLMAGMSAIMDIKVARPVNMVNYSELKEMGRFMLRREGSTVAAGVVVKILRNQEINIE